MPKKLLLALAALLFVFSAQAQQVYRVSGTMVDSSNKSPMIGASVLLQNVADPGIKAGTSTDVNGDFIISVSTPGMYVLKASYVGYNTFSRRVNVNQQEVKLGALPISPTSLNLKTVTIKEHQTRATQNGDTTEINAGAFKTTQDATAQDLLTKMPGITNNNGTIQAHGEDVKQVLVDGKPFFGDDPNAALKNLPAEVIDKVQVYDKLSDQAQFTGFNDGQTTKTINIITKKGKNNGQFGKLYAGYGTDNRYLVGGNVNLFKGNRRISIIGLSNNVNQQNFSTDDLLGVLGGGGQSRGMGMMRRGGGGGGMRPGGGNYPGNPASNFMVNQQGGITTTHALGLNYSDSLGKKVFLSGSYFFNMADNRNLTTLNRTYFTKQEVNPLYYQNSYDTNRNINNRLNLRLEYNIDTSNALIFTPRISLQNNNAISRLLGVNSLGLDTQSHSQSVYDSKNNGYNASGDILYRHRFHKAGRTVSLDLNGSGNNRMGNSSLNSQSIFYGIQDSTVNLDQQSSLANNGYSIAPSLNYTEPVGKGGQLMVTYNPSYTYGFSDKRTYNASGNNEYTLIDSSLSNTFNSTATSQSGGLHYRFSKSIFNMMLGASYKNTLLEGQQEFPGSFTVRKNFNNVLPMAMLNMKFSKTSNLRLFYRTSTDLPSVTQLQNVVDNSNPLFLSAGNPNLSQQYSHTVFARLGITNPKKGRNFFMFLFGSLTNNYIANSTTVALRDTMVGNGVTLYQGSQYTQPVNLQGYRTLRSFLTYGLPLDFIKCNLNLMGAFSYSRVPGLINNAMNLANTYNLSPGLNLGSNISDKIDFSLTYFANYNIVNNTIQQQLNNNYFYQTTTFRLTWIFWKGFTVNTDLTHYIYTGLASAYNQRYMLWNASLGKKFLKNQNGELRLSVYDLLNQNRSITRNVTETYIEDQQTQVLRRYFMLSFFYNLRNFKGGAAPASNPNANPNPMPHPWQH